MLILYRATDSILSELMQESKCTEIDGLLLPVGQEIAPHFLLELASDRLQQDPKNSFCGFLVLLWSSDRL